MTELATIVIIKMYLLENGLDGLSGYRCVCSVDNLLPDDCNDSRFCKAVNFENKNRSNYESKKI
jgi:hypothetical protein